MVAGRAPVADHVIRSVVDNDEAVERDDASVFADFIAVPEPSGAHVVLIGGNRLLMAASAPRSAELFARLGYEPIVVDISEYEKLEGCVTCLSVWLRSA